MNDFFFPKSLTDSYLCADSTIFTQDLFCLSVIVFFRLTHYDHLPSLLAAQLLYLSIFPFPIFSSLPCFSSIQHGNFLNLLFFLISVMSQVFSIYFRVQNNVLNTVSFNLKIYLYHLSLLFSNLSSDVFNF
jgi:hypothetical protein